jgi:hypothetical protein
MDPVWQFFVNGNQCVHVYVSSGTQYLYKMDTYAYWRYYQKDGQWYECHSITYETREVASPIDVSGPEWERVSTPPDWARDKADLCV